MSSKMHMSYPLAIGTFVKPSKAQLRSIRDEHALREVWQETGECIAYPKPDGWRMQVHKIGTEVKLFSRSGQDWTHEFSSAAQIIAASPLEADVILDTELVGYGKDKRHLQSHHLRHAPKHKFVILDLLQWGNQLTANKPTAERVRIIESKLADSLSEYFSLAEYTPISTFDGLSALYTQCLQRKHEGFDGMIVKDPAAPYASDVLKLKSEETIDAVVIGAYCNRAREVMSLLLAVPTSDRSEWIPIARVSKSKIDWPAVWHACQSYLEPGITPDTRLSSRAPDLWIEPRIVLQVAFTRFQKGVGYALRAEYARECVLREDKDAGEATTFDQVLKIAGIPADDLPLSPQEGVTQLRLL
jgi:DNA ligase 1